MGKDPWPPVRQAFPERLLPDGTTEDLGTIRVAPQAATLAVTQAHAVAMWKFLTFEGGSPHSTNYVSIPERRSETNTPKPPPHWQDHGLEAVPAGQKKGGQGA